jgi:hypothetical protein
MRLHRFESCDHAVTVVAQWLERYDRERPHSALGYLTPNEYRQKLAETRGTRTAPQRRQPSSVGRIGAEKGSMSAQRGAHTLNAALRGAGSNSIGGAVSRTAGLRERAAALLPLDPPN